MKNQSILKISKLKRWIETRQFLIHIVQLKVQIQILSPLFHYPSQSMLSQMYLYDEIVCNFTLIIVLCQINYFGETFPFILLNEITIKKDTSIFKNIWPLFEEYSIEVCCGMGLLWMVLFWNEVIHLRWWGYLCYFNFGLFWHEAILVNLRLFWFKVILVGLYRRAGVILVWVISYIDLLKLIPKPIHLAKTILLQSGYRYICMYMYHFLSYPKYAFFEIESHFPKQFYMESRSLEADKSGTTSLSKEGVGKMVYRYDTFKKINQWTFRKMFIFSVSYLVTHSREICICL